MYLLDITAEDETGVVMNTTDAAIVVITVVDVVLLATE